MKKILTCLDSSPRAPKVLATAVELAERTGAKVTLFRCVGVPPDIAQRDVIGISPSELMDRLVEDAKKDLTRLAAEVPTQVQGGIEVRVGTPWDGICAGAQALDADLIVIGSHGYGGLDRLLGTTAAKVVNHADRSVLVVR